GEPSMSSVITTETFLAMTPILRNEMGSAQHNIPRKDFMLQNFRPARQTPSADDAACDCMTGSSTLEIREESNLDRHGRRDRVTHKAYGGTAGLRQPQVVGGPRSIQARSRPRAGRQGG